MWKVLSRGIHMRNMKALPLLVFEIWPMFKFFKSRSIDLSYLLQVVNWTLGLCTRTFHLEKSGGFRFQLENWGVQLEIGRWPVPTGEFVLQLGCSQVWKEECDVSKVWATLRWTYIRSLVTASPSKLKILQYDDCLCKQDRIRYRQTDWQMDDPRTRQIIWYRATATLRRPQMKQYKASK